MTLLQFHSLKSQMHSGNLKIMIFLRAVSVRLSWSRMRSLSQSTFENFHLQKGFYIFTLLMFRKTNKTTINKNKTINSYTSFRFSFIFRYFKAFQLSPNIHIWSVWFVITCGQLVVSFLWYCEDLFQKFTYSFAAAAVVVVVAAAAVVLVDEEEMEGAREGGRERIRSPWV